MNVRTSSFLGLLGFVSMLQLSRTIGSKAERGRFTIQVTGYENSMLNAYLDLNKTKCDLNAKFRIYFKISSYMTDRVSGKTIKRSTTTKKKRIIPIMDFFPQLMIEWPILRREMIKIDIDKAFQHVRVIPLSLIQDTTKYVNITVEVRFACLNNNYDRAIDVYYIQMRSTVRPFDWKVWDNKRFINKELDQVIYDRRVKGVCKLECFKPFGGPFCSELMCVKTKSSPRWLCPNARGWLTIRIVEYHNWKLIDDDDERCDPHEPCEIYFRITSYLTDRFAKQAKGKTTETSAKNMYENTPIKMDVDDKRFHHVRAIPVDRNQSRMKVMGFTVAVYDWEKGWIEKSFYGKDDLMQRHYFLLKNLRPSAEWKYVWFKEDKTQYVDTQTQLGERHFQAWLKVAYKLECHSLFKGVFCSETIDEEPTKWG